MSDPAQHLSARNVAERLDVSERQVRRWIGSGQLRSVKLGPRCVRIPLASVLEFVEGGNASDDA